MCMNIHITLYSLISLIEPVNKVMRKISLLSIVLVPFLVSVPGIFALLPSIHSYGYNRY